MVVASEPILADYGIPWGLRTDGEALWAMRNFGWLELGFRQSYFEAALARTGWTAEKHVCSDPGWASVWIARHGEADPDAQIAAPPAPPSIVPAEPPGPSEAERALADELRWIYASTSWRITAPLRAVGRLLGRR